MLESPTFPDEQKVQSSSGKFRNSYGLKNVCVLGYVLDGAGVVWEGRQVHKLAGRQKRGSGYWKEQSYSRISVRIHLR